MIPEGDDKKETWKRKAENKLHKPNNVKAAKVDSW